MESATGLHQHDYYEFTIVLSGKCYQEINGKRVLLERGISSLSLLAPPPEFYEFGATKIFNVAVSKAFFEEHYLQQLPRCFVALAGLQPEERVFGLYRIGGEFAAVSRG